MTAIRGARRDPRPARARASRPDRERCGDFPWTVPEKLPRAPAESALRVRGELFFPPEPERVEKFPSEHVRAMHAIPLPVGRREEKDWANRRPVKKAKGRGDYVGARHARRSDDALARRALAAVTRGMGLSRPERMALAQTWPQLGMAIRLHALRRGLVEGFDPLVEPDPTPEPVAGDG